MDECKVCANADNEYCFACDNGNQFKPMTNADLLRRMSDEEFATAICKHDGCPFREAKDDECLKYHCDCKACWLDWLRQEAE